MTNLSSFDLDFSYGREGEQLVEDLLTNGKTIEVKRDRKWHATGNLYIEVSCWYQRSDSWEPSGLSVTKASYWAFVLEGTVLMVPTENIKWAINRWGREITCEIPPNRSKGYLITVEDLMNAAKELRNV
jgi:hypothetical protein